jgi:hypothetical protein
VEACGYEILTNGEPVLSGQCFLDSLTVLSGSAGEDCGYECLEAKGYLQSISVVNHVLLDPTRPGW